MEELAISQVKDSVIIISSHEEKGKEDTIDVNFNDSSKEATHSNDNNNNNDNDKDKDNDSNHINMNKVEFILVMFG